MHYSRRRRLRTKRHLTPDFRASTATLASPDGLNDALTAPPADTYPGAGQSLLALLTRCIGLAHRSIDLPSVELPPPLVDPALHFFSRCHHASDGQIHNH